MPAFLSLILPGLGQFIQGRIITAMICFVLTVAGYICFVIPGLFIHALVIADAYSVQKRRDGQSLKRALQDVYKP